MRVTIAKPNVYNAYGILLPQGSIQTVDTTFGASLVYALQALDTDGVLSAPVTTPVAAVADPRRSVESISSPATRSTASFSAAST